MPKQSKQQKETVGRVMHEFKRGELESSTGKKVKNPKQAIAIGLHEAGASRDESPQKNKENLRKTKAKEQSGETTQALGETQARGETRASGETQARGETRKADTRAELYEEARRRNIPGRSSMSKAELLRAVRQ